MTARPVTPHAAVDHVRTGHFDEGPAYTTYRPNGAGDWLIILTLAGAGAVALNRRRRNIQPGQALLFALDCPHDYRTAPDVGRWELLWAHFRPHAHWHAWLDWPAAFTDAPDAGLGLIAIPDSPTFTRVAEALAEAHRHAAQDLPNAPMFALNALERALLCLDAANPNTGGRPVDDRIQRALNYIADHLAEPITIDDLARHVSLSPSRLGHLFKEQLNLTPLQAIERQRLDRARQLLQLSAHPINEVARRVGFNNPFYFSLRFRKHTDTSPREYRRQHQG